VHVQLNEYPLARGRYEAALPIYRDIGARVGEANTFTSLGELELAEQHIAEARSWYERALLIYREIGDRHWRSYIAPRLAATLLAASETTQALEILEEGAQAARAIDGHPNLSGILQQRASLYFELKDYAQAGADYQDLIALNSQDGWAHNGLANVFERQGNSEAALNEYTLTVQAQPAEPIFHRNRASTLITLNRLDEAREECEAATKLDPDHPYTHGRWGDWHLARGEWAQAEARYRYTLEHDTSDDKASWQFGLAVALWGHGQAEAGWAEFDSALARADAEMRSEAAREFKRLQSLFPALGELASAIERLTPA
jgi:tetratricopeptide (TPR) repeat protein